MIFIVLPASTRINPIFFLVVLIAYRISPEGGGGEKIQLEVSGVYWRHHKDLSFAVDDLFNR